ncbi:hypothetical protein BJ508DRAFT_309895 [Ascobolus immersus RN42]|uniref:Uncharacterized protein n=1 Tax=Ascobolus immersus RN42 TaxID=1160509 RepID=A0A3N4HV96_ASCIM|nr:hypothetical protein BJ508DRAFT_309895 [Ascobolus immersus RN42]
MTSAQCPEMHHASAHNNVRTTPVLNHDAYMLNAYRLEESEKDQEMYLVIVRDVDGTRGMRKSCKISSPPRMCNEAQVEEKFYEQNDTRLKLSNSKPNKRDVRERADNTILMVTADQQRNRDKELSEALTNSRGLSYDTAPTHLVYRCQKADLLGFFTTLYLRLFIGYTESIRAFASRHYRETATS